MFFLFSAPFKIMSVNRDKHVFVKGGLINVQESISLNIILFESISPVKRTKIELINVNVPESVYPSILIAQC